MKTEQKVGIFQDSAEVYHGEKHIGSTSLKEMRFSPAHFYWAWTGPAKKSKVFDEGTVTHDVCLEQTTDRFVVVPEGAPKKPSITQRNAKKPSPETVEAIAYWDKFEIESAGKIVIDAELRASLDKRLDSFASNKEAMRLYNNAKVEESIYVHDHESGLYIKARPDLNKHGILIDFKTVSLASQFQKQFWALGYNIQAGHYANVYEAAKGIPVTEFYFIVMEKKAPFAVQVVRVPRHVLEDCKLEARRLLNQAGVCVVENEFPAYGDTIVDIAERPAWMDDSMTASAFMEDAG